MFADKTPLVSESRGDDFPDKTFFVIRRGGDCGLFSYFLTTLSGIKYAVDRGWIPIVDMRSDPNIYLEENEVGHVNAWELFFDQPAGFGLDDIAHARNVIVTKCFPWPDLPPATIAFLSGQDGLLAYWREMVKRYIRPSKYVLEELARVEAALFPDDFNRVLGVFIRGTDYAHLHPINHTVQPTAARVIADVRRRLEDGMCDRVFLVTEDRSIESDFKAAFGSRLILHEQNTAIYTGGFIGNCHPEKRRDRERFHQGVDYLVNILLLSKCHMALASRASGTTGVALLASHVWQASFYNLGIYTRWGTKIIESGGLQ